MLQQGLGIPALRLGGTQRQLPFQQLPLGRIGIDPVALHAAQFLIGCTVFLHPVQALGPLEALPHPQRLLGQRLRPCPRGHCNRQQQDP